VTFTTLLVIGGLGLPRRQAVYPPEFQFAQQLATIGGYVIGLAALLWLYNMLVSYWRGQRVQSTDPWDLKETQQFTREWQWFEDRLVEQRNFTPAKPDTVRRSYAPEAEPSGLAGGVGTVAQNVVRNASMAAAGGFVGTVLMVGGLGTAVIVGVLDPASFTEIAELVGLPASLAVGAALFLVGGTVTWPLVFLAFQQFLPGRYLFETGLVFASLMSTGFVIAFYTGQQGLVLIGYVAFVVVAHWTYGLGLAVTLQYLRKRQRSREGGA
jgi:cytochrome c oxidase subunit 1